MVLELLQTATKLTSQEVVSKSRVQVDNNTSVSSMTRYFLEANIGETTRMKLTVLSLLLKVPCHKIIEVVEAEKKLGENSNRKIECSKHLQQRHNINLLWRVLETTEQYYSSVKESSAVVEGSGGSCEGAALCVLHSHVSVNTSDEVRLRETFLCPELRQAGDFGLFVNRVHLLLIPSSFTSVLSFFQHLRQRIFSLICSTTLTGSTDIICPDLRSQEKMVSKNNVLELGRCLDANSVSKYLQTISLQMCPFVHCSSSLLCGSLFKQCFDFLFVSSAISPSPSSSDYLFVNSIEITIDKAVIFGADVCKEWRGSVLVAFLLFISQSNSLWSYSQRSVIVFSFLVASLTCSLQNKIKCCDFFSVAENLRKDLDDTDQWTQIQLCGLHVMFALDSLASHSCHSCCNRHSTFTAEVKVSVCSFNFILFSSLLLQLRTTLTFDDGISRLTFLMSILSCTRSWLMTLETLDKSQINSICDLVESVIPAMNC